MTLPKVEKAWRNALLHADIPGGRRVPLRGVVPVAFEGKDNSILVEAPDELYEGVVKFLSDRQQSASLREALDREARKLWGVEGVSIYLKPETPSDNRDYIPGGFELPNGTVVAHPAHRKCDCYHCKRAFEALENGNLTFKGVLDR